jgi:endoglucanase
MSLRFLRLSCCLLVGILSVSLLTSAGAQGGVWARQLRGDVHSPSPSATVPWSAPPGSPVAKYGQLRVCERRLCQTDGTHVQLRGMSTHGIQWYANCVTKSSLRVLARQWQASVVRISLYVQDDGYETNPKKFTRLTSRLVRQASAHGLYVLIDWHILDPGDPQLNLDLAKRFFKAMTARFGDQPNIIYEIANEPNGVTWAQIRSYAEEIIPVIRRRDREAPIVVGTPAWSSLGISENSEPQEVIDNPLKARNLLYTFHFYAASHGQKYRDAVKLTASKLPLFVTEFGTQRYTGNGPNNFVSTRKYLNLLDRRDISWVNWNFSDDRRSGAVFTQGTCDAGKFGDATQLKASGKWIRSRLRNPPAK